MARLPKLPDPSGLGSFFSVIDKAGGVIDKGLGLIDKVSDRLEKIGLTEEPRRAPETPTTAPESQEEPPFSQSEAITKGTACLPCCRDHLSTSSSALSEGIRFARDKGIKDPEALRRIRIALDELNAMERIDLAPDETARLKGAEKDLANWTLKGSREIRHTITAIKDVDSMEQAAAKASAITEEFISRLWAIPEEECETCGEARESIRQFIEKKKRERRE